MSYSDIRGKRALVTGAGTGIGREVGLEFARAGADVVFHYSQSAAGAVSAAEEAASHGVRATALQADLASLDATDGLAAAAAGFLGGVDILINNSGITYNRSLAETEAERFQRIYDVNVRAGYRLTQKLVPGMIGSKGGVICNLTSVHGLQGAAEHSAYAGTKGAIIAQTRALAVELAPHGIRVNAIAPGWIHVENHALAARDYDADGARKAASEKIPVGRYGTPLDVARLAVFLCSEAASFIVGQTIVIDGGTTALMSLFTDFRSPSTTRYGERYLRE